MSNASVDSYAQSDETSMTQEVRSWPELLDALKGCQRIPSSSTPITTL